MFNNLTIKARLLTLIGLLSVVLIVIGAAGLKGMHDSNGGLRTVYLDRTIPAIQLAEIMDLVNDSVRQLYLVNSQEPRVHDGTQPTNITEAIDKNITGITKLWNAYLATYLTPDEKVLADKFSLLLQDVEKNGLLTAIQLSNQGRGAETNRFMVSELEPKLDQFMVVMDDLKQLQADVAKQEYEHASADLDRTFVFELGLILLGIALSFVFGLAFIRNLSQQLGAEPKVVADLLAMIARGKLDNVILVNASDDRSILANLRFMQQQLMTRQTKEYQERDEFIRIKIALDSVTTNVMVADNERNIIYINPAAITMLQHAEADLRKVLPSFSAEKLLGVNMDSFHKNPAHQQALLAKLSSTYRTQISVGGRTFSLIANAINNDKGQRIGSVVEWKDRTAEVAIEQEVAKVVDGAVLGDFMQRIDEAGKEGFYLQLAQGINKLMDTSSTGLNEVVRVLEAIARGDLTETIVNDYSGTFGQLKDDSNTTVAKLKEIIGQIKEASETISTAASMQELTSTVRHTTENAQHANELAIKASDIAGKGVLVVTQVVDTMASIHDSSRKVEDIIAVIDGIAFQTNILALNAAVEAARAGEQGRGFAVVAGEVRNLAQRAAAAAGEIKGLIGDSVNQIEDGARLVTHAGKTMEEIVSSIQGVSAIMSNIAAASLQQTSGIEQVNLAIGQMDDVTQQNAALVEQAAASAESLEEQTQNLAGMVGQFKVDNRSFARLAIEHASAVNSSSNYLEKTLNPPEKAIGVADWEEF
ncbi:MAG: methyl-accepting chemotaxis protein [Methylococcaceae bacterium]|nr:methyl-accepting chemotaxis protein [Methylococcaceae bacterium]MDZ4155147.1 methyl-accepting chemotaxis protein [Methylococcales bacterium]MDP2394409.1 methyl-accepting chemotaxis protein [Methylococcaceae bacterium]MDP3021452.1 methyl-accepting chemotaxis protein [Methylococcaceae bacterium]MDP3388574.1 methyl-accepting chemotaxis protein [Methylococcaceae bacterium]